MTITTPEAGTVMGQVVQPTAFAGPVASAVFAVGQVLKDLVHGSGVYKSEPDILNAIQSVDAMVSAFVKPSERPALVTGEERAPMEDVSLRIPPRQVQVPGPVVNQVIDYDKLAAAIVRQQQALSQQAEVTTGS